MCVYITTSICYDMLRQFSVSSGPRKLQPFEWNTTLHLKHYIAILLWLKLPMLIDTSKISICMPWVYFIHRKCLVPGRGQWREVHFRPAHRFGKIVT